MDKYFKLFGIFFKVGAFTFGGGYAMIPIIQKEIVEKEGLIDYEEFIDIIAVCQSLPGPIAVNTTLYVGYKLLGLLGALAALIGTVLPSFMVISVLAVFYNRIKHIKTIQLFFKGVRPAIVALIFLSALKLGAKIERKQFNIVVMAAAFSAIAFFDVSPIFVIIGCAIAGLLYQQRRRQDDLS